MQRLEVSGAVRPIYGSLGVKRLIITCFCQSYTENQNTQIIFNNFIFKKILHIMRQLGKVWCRQTDCRWQYNMAHALSMQNN